MINTKLFDGEDHRPFVLEGNKNAAVLLIHGFPGSPREMRPLGDLFHESGWAAHGLLLPGFGPELETIIKKTHDDWLNAVKAALRPLREQYETVVLVGNSMGGALSIEATAEIKVDGLVLFAPFYRVDHILWGMLPVLRYVIPTFKPFRLFKPDFNDPEFRRGTRNFMPDADFDDPVFQEQTLNFEVQTVVFEHIRRAGAGAYEAAPQVDTPTLVFQGHDDELVTPELTQQLIGRLQTEADYVEVAAEHNPLQPDKPYWPDVTRKIQAFIDSFEESS